MFTSKVNTLLLSFYKPSDLQVIVKFMIFFLLKKSRSKKCFFISCLTIRTSEAIILIIQFQILFLTLKLLGKTCFYHLHLRSPRDPIDSSNSGLKSRARSLLQFIPILVLFESRSRHDKNWKIFYLSSNAEFMVDLCRKTHRKIQKGRNGFGSTNL